MTFDAMSFILGTFSGLFVGLFFVYFVVKWSYEGPRDVFRKPYIVRNTRL